MLEQSGSCQFTPLLSHNGCATVTEP